MTEKQIRILSAVFLPSALLAGWLGEHRFERWGAGDWFITGLCAVALANWAWEAAAKRARRG